MRVSPWIKIIIFLLILTFILLALVYFYQSDKNLHVWFLDVGEGDAILIRTPQHQDILIDGGPSRNLTAKLGKYIPFYDREIELVILTHPQTDHYRGLQAAQKYYRFAKVLVNGEEKNKEIFSDFSVAEKGDEFIIDEIKLEILNPDKLEGEANENSIVARMCYIEICFLFTGDAGFATEEKLLKEDVRAQVLKVGHHGSKYATSQEFLSEVQPEYAVISAGKNNPYHHPHPSLLARLKSVEVLRTDLLGDIKCTSNGEDVFCESSP